MPAAVARKTCDLFRTAKTSSRGCSARSIGRPLKAIDPASTLWPDETRKLPSGWRPIQTGASRDIPRTRAARAKRLSKSTTLDLVTIMCKPRLCGDIVMLEKA